MPVQPARNPFIDDEAQGSDTGSDGSDSEDFIDDTPGHAGSANVRRDRDTMLPQRRPTLLSTFQDIMDTYTPTSPETIDGGPSVDGSDSEDDDDESEIEDNLQSDPMQDLRATAEEIAKHDSLRIVRFSIRTGSRNHLMRRVQTVFRWLDCVCDFWIARGAGTHRYLYVVYVELRAQAQDAGNLQFVRDGVASLHTLLDAQSEYKVQEPQDRVTTLISRARSRLPMNWAGKWVIIPNGPYLGDLGFVRAGPDIYWDWLSSFRGSWVEILVVPRVFDDPALREYDESLNENGKRDPSQDDEGPLPKRLHSNRNSPKRFDPRLLSDRRGLTLANEGRHWQVYEQFKDVVFAKDLVVIRVPAKGLRLALMTPPQSRAGFLASENEEINRATLPPPSMCTLEEDERVFHRPTRWVGYVVEWRGDTILAYNVVDGDKEERILPTSEINKYFDVGEYVEVIGIDESMECVIGSGWVIQNIPGALLQLFSHRSTPEGHTGELYDLDANFCRATTAFWKGPNALTRRVPDSPLSTETVTKTPQNQPPHMTRPGYYTGVIPWKGLDVVVTGNHAFKGQRANVVDVNITPGATKSGLRVSVVMYNSVAQTSYKENLDYADVLDERTGWPLRVANPISPRHIQAGFCGDIKNWHQEMVQYFGRTYQERDLRRISPPPPQFDLAGGGANASTNVAEHRSDDSWICQEFLCGIAVQVFRKSSRAQRPKSIPVMYNKGGIFQVDLEKDILKGKEIPPNDVVAHHPGRWPAAGKCWMVLEGPWQGKYVHAIQYKHLTEEFEGTGERNVPHWEVFEVTRDVGLADIPTGRTLLIRDEYLIVLGESQAQLKLNEHLRSLQVGSRVENALDPWTVGPEE